MSTATAATITPRPRIVPLGRPTTLGAYDTMEATGADLLDTYLREIGAIPLLDRDTEYTLACRAAKGDATARQTLVTHNLRLVASIARTYHLPESVTLLDAIQEGSIGLMRAIERFDPARGNKLSTYATWWIRQAIGRAVQETGDLIRVPVHTHTAISKVRRARAIFTQANPDAVPTDAALLAATGLREGEYRNAREAQITHRVLSLDEPINLNDDPSDAPTLLGEMIPDPAYEGGTDTQAVAGASDGEMQEILRDALSPRERRVIRLRFGMAPWADHPHTLEEIGKALHISRERVRQVEGHALTKLRLKMGAPALDDAAAHAARVGVSHSSKHKRTA